MMAAMDRSVAWRSAVIFGVALAIAAVVLALALPRSFFEDWGWLAGPAAWVACAAFTGAVLRLPLVGVLLGAALAGVPSVVAVVLGAHWLGAALAVGVFAAWCGRLAVRSEGMSPG